MVSQHFILKIYLLPRVIPFYRSRASSVVILTNPSVPTEPVPTYPMSDHEFEGNQEIGRSPGGKVDEITQPRIESEHASGS